MNASVLRCGLAVFLGAIILLLVAVINGRPFFFPDTSNYIRAPDAAVTALLGTKFATSWNLGNSQYAKREVKGLNTIEEGIIISGRSPYYGALLYLGEIAGGLWLSAFFQAALVSYVLFVLLVRCCRLSTGFFLLSLLGLTLLSTVSFFASFLMPDIFAGLTILVTAMLLVFWADLGRIERMILSLLLIFFMLSHVTHFLICFGMFIVHVLARAVLRKQDSLRRASIAAVAMCMLVAMVGEMAFNVVVSKAVGFAPVRPPFVSGRLIQIGPGLAYMKAHCHESPFVICRFADQMPLHIDSFLWSRDRRTGVFSVVDADTKRALGDEQYRFALKVFFFDPLGVIGGLVRAGAAQFLQFGLSEFEPCSNCEILYTALPENYVSMLRAPAGLQQTHVNLTAVVAKATVILSALYLVVVLFRSMRMPPSLSGKPPEVRNQLIWFTTLVGTRIAANAAICGAFSALHDRYQARVIWLVPLLALMWLWIQWGRGKTSEVRISDTNPVTRNVQATS